MRTLRDMSRGSFRASSVASAGMLKLASLTAPMLVCGLFATSALANDDRLSLAECEQSSAESAVVVEPDLLDPTLRGVGLDDLDDDTAHMVSGYLRLKGVLPLNAVLSTSIVEPSGP